MEHAWHLTKGAIRDLESLDKRFVDQFFKKIDAYCSTPDPMKFAAPLTGAFKGFYRFRIGDYRAIFRKEPSGMLILLLILRVKHRKEIYR